MKKMIALALLFGMVGCTNSQKVTDEVFPLYRGKPIETVIVRWGPPENVMRVDTGTIYTFTNSMQYTSSAIATSTGTVGTAPVLVTSSVPTTANLSCRQEVHTDTAGRIIYIGGVGNSRACITMLNGLR